MSNKRKRELLDVLGLQGDPNEEEIKRAYKKMAITVHPDRHQGDREKEIAFQKLTEAYDELLVMNQNLARLKTVFKSTHLQQSLDHFFSTGNIGSFKFNSFSSEDGTASNINTNSSMTNSESRVLRKEVQVNLQTSLNVTFNESIFGCKKTIQFKRTIVCKHCTDSVNGNSQIVDLEGELCAFCAGKKRMTVVNTTSIEVPPGVVNNSKRVLTGLGDEAEGIVGNLIVIFQVEENSFYKRDGANCICTVSIPFPHAVLGTQIQIPSLYDKILTVRVEPGTSHGKIIKLPGEGFFDGANQKTGDFLIQIEIEMPTSISPEERELLKKLTVSPNFQAKPISVQK